MSRTSRTVQSTDTIPTEPVLPDDQVLSVSNIRVFFALDEGTLKAVDDISFSIKRNEVLGIIGESGCGKSVTAQAVLRIIPAPGTIESGSILFRDQDGTVVDLVDLDPRGEEIRRIRGREIAMIFQEPMTSLSPVHTIGDQIIERIVFHRTSDKKEARQIAIEMLKSVRIPDPEERIDSYPHELSGGLRQRAMIAMALSCRPSMLIADEPTTALDVTVQAQILQLIKNLQDEFGMAVMYITHNLGVIAELADHVAVMYLGKIVEFGTKRQVFDHPLHPYTKLLFKSIPHAGRAKGQKLEAIEGNVPLPIGLPDVCPFVDRCPSAIRGTCDAFVPAIGEIDAGHTVRCFLYEECAPVGDDAEGAACRQSGTTLDGRDYREEINNG